LAFIVRLLKLIGCVDGGAADSPTSNTGEQHACQRVLVNGISQLRQGQPAPPTALRPAPANGGGIHQSLRPASPARDVDDVLEIAATNPGPKNLSRGSRYKMLTIAPRETQHLVVHRFARERDEKGMR
jgi:hypothetical protein